MSLHDVLPVCPLSREIDLKATQIRRAAVGIDDGVIRVLRIQIPACCSEHEPVRRAYHGLQLDTAGARLSHVGRGLDEGVVRPWQRRCPLKIVIPDVKQREVDQEGPVEELGPCADLVRFGRLRSEIGRDTSELQSLMRISYAVFCLKK